MRLKLALAAFLAAPLMSCSQANGFRFVNLSERPLVVVDRFRDKRSTILPGAMSKNLLLTKSSQYELLRPEEPNCRYSYPSITEGTFPIPDGRRIFDGKSPRTLTLVTVDENLVARAYAYQEGKSIEQSAEFQRGGFPARPVRICADTNLRQSE